MQKLTGSDETEQDHEISMIQNDFSKIGSS